MCAMFARSTLYPPTNERDAKLVGVELPKKASAKKVPAKKAPAKKAAAKKAPAKKAAAKKVTQK
jgi:heparin binding hemagglutinin HbhA